MIKYLCNECKIEYEKSECPICKKKEINRAKQEKRAINSNAYRNELIGSQIYWCEECNVPLYNEECSICSSKGRKLTTDLRPVFPEERLLLEVLLGEPFKFSKSSVWKTGASQYVIDGKKLKVSQRELMNKDSKEVIKELELESNKLDYSFFEEIIEKFVRANRSRFNDIDEDAITYIQEISKGYDKDEMFVSFSGGKDSTVISDLTVRGLGDPGIVHIFGDTTLEFVATMDYLKRFRKNNRFTPVLKAKNKEKNFFDMCDIVGPPSRVMRWCCIVFKTGAITRKIDGVFKGKKRLLTFYGIRRNESASRNKYEKESESPKITKQKVVSPIIDWIDFDIWLYILSRKIDFNDAYRLGFARVGCWCCPNNSDWSQYLSSIYMTEKYDAWRDQLIKFAKSIGKPDPEVYIDDGWWKARQGGNGIDISKNTFVEVEECVKEENALSYELKKEISDQLYEMFKPFGYLNYDLGNKRLNEVFILNKKGDPILSLKGKKGTKILTVTIHKIPIGKWKSMRDIKQKIDCQITKYQMCLGCLACESVCKHDAIKVIKSNKEDSINGYEYIIDDEKCVRCGDCIGHFTGGCYMRKVLITRRGDKNE